LRHILLSLNRRPRPPAAEVRRPRPVRCSRGRGAGGHARAIRTTTGSASSRRWSRPPPVFDSSGSHTLINILPARGARDSEVGRGNAGWLASSLNQALKQPGLAGLKWRMEATARHRSPRWCPAHPPSASSTCFIHRKTGLMLEHVAADRYHHDPQLVSGMLSAIQDFVRDCSPSPPWAASTPLLGNFCSGGGGPLASRP
jgi:hypothetical protein